MALISGFGIEDYRADFLLVVNGLEKFLVSPRVTRNLQARDGPDVLLLEKFYESLNFRREVLAAEGIIVDKAHLPVLLN